MAKFTPVENSDRLKKALKSDSTKHAIQHAGNAALLYVISTLMALALFATGCAPSESSPSADPTPSPTNGKLAQIEALVEEGEIEEAAKALNKLSVGSLSWLDIVGLFEGHMDLVDIKMLSSPLPDVDHKDDVGMLNGILEYKMPYYVQHFKERVPETDILEYANFSYDHDWSFSLQESIGGAPEGKILIYQLNSTPTSTSHPMYAWGRSVLLSAVALLDEGYVPASLDQVQYLLVLNYELQYDCTYENGVVGSKVFATLQLLEYPGEKLIYDFGAIEGGDLPDKIPDRTEKVVTGSYPKQDQVTDLLLDAIKQINDEPALIFGS